MTFATAWRITFAASGGTDGPTSSAVRTHDESGTTPSSSARRISRCAMAMIAATTEPRERMFAIRPYSITCLENSSKSPRGAMPSTSDFRSIESSASFSASIW